MTTATSVQPSCKPLTALKGIPLVMFSPEAYATIQAAITSQHKARNEITLFGIVDVESKAPNVYIPKMYVPEQEVTATTTECPNLGVIAREAFEDGYNPCQLNFWMHLHPGSMATNPSGTDEATTKEYLEQWPYLLRGIINNVGSFKLDYYHKESNCLYSNLRHVVDYPNVIDAEALEETIKARVKTKVRTYVNNNTGITVRDRTPLGRLKESVGTIHKGVTIYAKTEELLVDGEDVATGSYLNSDIKMSLIELIMNNLITIDPLLGRAITRSVKQEMPQASDEVITETIALKLFPNTVEDIYGG